MEPKVKLKDIPTVAPEDVSKELAKKDMALLLEEFSELQNRLYASAAHSLLVILQGMDASGKDGAIRDVFSSVNPQGIIVHSFKVPSAEEAAHDFLWRIHLRAPAKGMINVFNRSHYEDVLVTRVHKWCSDELAYKRMQAINHFEELLTEHNNTTLIKFYLHVSKEEQQSRLNERVHNPSKRWKYNARDFEEAARYDEYHQMYEDCFEQCSKVPWIIVPADQNWYKEYVMVKVIVERLRTLNLQYPADV